MDGEINGKPLWKWMIWGGKPTIFGNIQFSRGKNANPSFAKKQLLDSRLTPAVRCPGFCWLPIRSFSSPLGIETSDSGMTVSCASRGCLVESWLPSTDVQLECTCNMLQPQYPTFTRGLEPKYYNYSQILATSWYRMRLCSSSFLESWPIQKSITPMFLLTFISPSPQCVWRRYASKPYVP